MTESKPRESASSLSPHPAARTRAAQEKGSPLVIVASHKRALQNAQAQDAHSDARSGAFGRRSGEGEAHQANSLYQFQRTELGADFNKVFKNKKLPFKYRTLVYLQKILFCKEVEADIKAFRAKEERVRQRWQYEHKMTSDIARTRHLKDRPQLHSDAKRIVEFYCHTHNVSYCQGMLEVLMPFLFMKQKGADKEEQKGTDRAQYSASLFGVNSGMMCNDTMSQVSKSSNGLPRSGALQPPGSGSTFFDLACVYAFFKRFVRSFIPNNLHTKFNGRSAALPYLKGCLHLTDLLLHYVDTEIHAHLRKKKVTK